MKRLTLILLIIFVFLFSDLVLLGSYESSWLFLKFDDLEQSNTLAFLKDKEPLTVEFNEKEISHLNDVKKVMGWADYYFIFLLVAEIFILAMIFQTDKKEFYKVFFYGGIVSLGFIFLILLLVLIDFDLAFTLFHQIFFPQGNWQFAAGDKLITLFTFEFFYQTALWIFVKAVIFSVLMVLVGWGLRKKKWY